MEESDSSKVVFDEINDSTYFDIAEGDIYFNNIGALRDFPHSLYDKDLIMPDHVKRHYEHCDLPMVPRGMIMEVQMVLKEKKQKGLG